MAKQTEGQKSSKQSDLKESEVERIVNPTQNGVQDCES